VKKNLSGCITAITLFAALTIPSLLSAQQPRYKLIDIGTFGGPQSYVNSENEGNNSAAFLSNRGTLAGWADTSAADPFPNFCFNEDCFVSHAFQWRNGVRTDLGALADGVSSQANWISGSGLIAGVSENGEIDPLISGFPELRAVLWRNGRITDLGTLPEGGYESLANAVNSRGQVVGSALNTIPDPDSMVGAGYQTRAFLWQNGAMQDLGTLGTGTDAEAEFINEQGQVVGWSYISSDPNTGCPNVFPLALRSFIWDKKNGMRDLGTLGGTCTQATGLNNRGTVIGDYVDATNQFEHAFSWQHGVIQNLGGSLGGDDTGAEAINGSGQVAGWAYFSGDTLFHAALWIEVGNLIDLGALGEDPCSFASSINVKAQIVGGSLAGCNFDNNTRAFLWEGGSIFDLNSLIPPGAPLHLQWAQDINDRGEITGTGVDANGNIHAFLLIPCGADDANRCQNAAAGTASTVSASPAPTTQRPASKQSNSIRQMLRRRPGPVNRFPGFAMPKN
jgi:probable HAF family extracellular repeat protein